MRTHEALWIVRHLLGLARFLGILPGHCCCVLSAFPTSVCTTIFPDLLPTSLIYGGDRNVRNALLKTHRGKQDCSRDLMCSLEANESSSLGGTDFLLFPTASGFNNIPCLQRVSVRYMASTLMAIARSQGGSQCRDAGWSPPPGIQSREDHLPFLQAVALNWNRVAGGCSKQGQRLVAGEGPPESFCRCIVVMQMRGCSSATSWRRLGGKGSLSETIQAFISCFFTCSAPVRSKDWP